MSDVSNPVDRLAALSDEQLEVLATMTDAELEALAQLEIQPTSVPTLIVHDDIVTVVTTDPVTPNPETPAETGTDDGSEETPGESETAETVALSEEEIIDLLASVNGEIGRAETFIAKGNGRLASKVIAGARDLLALVPACEDAELLTNELDEVALRADELPVPYATFPNPAHLKSEN